MPAMGDSVSEGTILEWHKQEGDSVSEDETIVEISTDKVDAEVPSPATGTVVKVHAAEGDTVHVGALLAEIALNGGAPSSGNGAATLAEPEAETEPRRRAEAGRAARPSRSRCPRWASRSPRASSSSGPSSPATRSRRTRRSSRSPPTRSTPRSPRPPSGVMGEILAEAGDTVTVGQVIGRMTVRPERRRPRRRRPRPKPAEPAEPGEPKEVVLPDGIRISPVARRVAAAEGIDLANVKGTRPRRPDPEGRRAGGRVRQRRRPRRGRAAENATLIKGASAMLARYMDESRSIPTATSFRTLTVTVLDARRKELKDAGHKVSFTHLIAYAIARAATEQMPVMAHHFAEIDGKPHRIDDGAVNLGIAVDVEKKDGGRTLMVPVIRDAGRLSFTGFLGAFNDLIARARENKLTADDLVGANVSLTNPGGIGTIASVPRLMTGQGTIVATGAIGYPPGLASIGSMIGAEKVMTMTSTYDHRVIQGAESGQFLQVVEAYLQGEHGFYEAVFKDLEAPLGPLAGAARARRRRGDRARRQARRATARAPERGAAAGRPGRGLAGQGAPHARPPRGQARPARLRARGRSRARSRAARPDARADGPDPRADPAHARPGRDARRRAAAPARDLLRHDRLRDRAHLLAPPAHLAAREDRVRRLPQAAHQRRGERAAAAPDDGRLARALHAQGLPGPEAVLDRGPRHDGPDARRDDPALGGQRRPRGRDRHGPPRPAQRARAQPRPRLRDDLARVRGRVLDRGRDHDPAGRHRRRQVPPRRPGHLPAARRPVGDRAAGVQPVAPRVRLAGRRGRHARRPDLAPGPARAHRQQRRDPDHPPRRRRLPRPGRGGGDAQPAGARRLPGRRHAAPDPEQPGRLHHRPGGGALHALGLGPREGLRRPDHPRQRRRRRGLRRRRAARLRVPPGVRPRRRHRPHRLPPLRPQRGRRARLHAARDGGQDQEQDAGARDLRRPARQAGRAHAGGVRRDRQGDLGRHGRAPPRAQGGALARRGRAAHRRLPARPLALARGQDRGVGRPPARAQRGPAARARGLQRPSQAAQAARAPARDDRPRRRHRLGARRGAGLRLAAERGHAGPPDRPGRRARHVLPAPPRAARRQDRPARLADPVAAGRARADGAAQLAAERDRLPRLRVRLLDGGARDARAVGGPVRRLHQLGPGDRRPVHHLARWPSGARPRA